MMTTMAALMGTLPIALGIGSGAEARRPLGLAVVGGLLVSQLLTLYITPVVYLYMDSWQGAFGPAWRRFRSRLGFRQPSVATEHKRSPEPASGVVGAVPKTSPALPRLD